MPLTAAPRHLGSDGRTVSYRDTLGRTYNAELTDLSVWKANAGVNYDLVTSVTLTIDGATGLPNQVTVDTTLATDLATMITTLNGDLDFAAIATAADSTETPGRLIITADAAGPHVIDVVTVGAMPGTEVGQLRCHNLISPNVADSNRLLSEVPPATTVKATNAYFYRQGPSAR